MRKLAVVSFLLFLGKFVIAQSIPILPVENLNMPSGTLNVQAPYEIFSPYQGLGPVLIYNTAQVDFKARDRVHLGPGFHSGSFSGNGYFHAQVGVVPDFDVVFIEPNSQYPNVGQFEKIEMGIKLPALIQDQIDNFNPDNFYQGMNPYDPEQISVEVLFTNGNQSYWAYGFHFRDYTRRADRINAPYTFDPLLIAVWDEQATDYPWRVRWAPPTTGVWGCQIYIRLNNALSYSYSVSGITFNCVASSNEGWLEKGQSNWNLRHSGTHNSFFVLGQNIAWNGTTEWNQPIFFGQYAYIGDNHDYLAYGGGYLDVLNWTENLADNGGNMVRVVSRRESFDFEGEHLNNYYEGMDRAWELDRMFELCEEKNMKIFFCSEFHPKFGHNVVGLSSWESNPYNLEIVGCDHPEDFLTNPYAIKKFKAKLRYFFARWGYSTSLGVFELLSEMDLWSYQGFDEYKDNTTAQNAQWVWHEEMLPYCKGLVSYRPILTASSYGVARGHELQHNNPVFNSSSLDITTTHSYFFERDVNHIRFLELNSPVVNQGTHAIWSVKPTVFDEMGLHDKDGADPDDMEGCSDISYHNALWSTAMMGGIGTGLQWWQWSNDDYREANFPAMATFFNDIDFESGNFVHPDFWDDALDPYHSTSIIEVFYNTANAKNKTMAWVHNASFYWGNMITNCVDRNHNSMQADFEAHDDLFPFPFTLPYNTKFEIHGLSSLQYYNVEYHATRNNGGLVGNSSLYQANIFGTLKPYWGVGQPDWAIKAYRTGNMFRMSDELTSDTLRCGEDTVYAEGNYVGDTLNMLNYHWIFGNGQVSNNRNDTVVYNNPGTYLVTLIVSDSAGWSDTLRQYVVVPDCNVTRQSALATSSHSSHIFPNPATEYFQLAIDSGFGREVSVLVYSANLDLIGEYTFATDSEMKIDIANWDCGIYFVVMRDAMHEETHHLIISR